ncbi:ABC transporter permease/substrate-binding protein [Aciduricibacillus chroicocephali]|uniref:ABC transporter permease/substrate-binding protein n=1 Tax=Aciduricibacillus chroicocephali TaxID=3054939 RepID=A0ABY9KYK2_9BACI|nr:ABC transporter permease/substrate-binding protein [Bacillaceae bacterium 44XB]
MNSFLHVLQTRKDVLLEKILEHIQMSLIALVIAMIIAVPLGLLLTRYKRVAEPVIGVTAILQTIPSLAILAFLIPLFGIGRIPAIIALIIYGLLPILRNTYTGITGVDPALVEAATGMGMNSFRRLMKIELPLAVPVIMAGIRTSMVLIVGTATIAALIGAGGLGELILLGLDRGADINLILLGAIPAAILAILLDLLLRGIERTTKKAGMKAFISMVVIVLLLAVVPSVVSINKKPDLVIGGKLGAEPEILINMYKLLIEDKTDLKVELKPGLGKTSLVFKALQNGDIDIYPEFTGTAIVTQLEQKARSNDAAQVYEQAKEGMKKKYNMAYLKPMQFNNTYTVALKSKLAEKYNLESIGDLRSVEDRLKAGFTLEFKDRKDGYRGMKSLYGIDFATVKTMDPGLRKKAVKKDEVEVIDAYATDSYVKELGLVSLKDPKHLFPPYQGAPLMREETLDKHPDIKKALNKIAGKITDEEMRAMNYEVDYKDRPAEEVAREYLVKNEIINK